MQWGSVTTLDNMTVSAFLPLPPDCDEPCAMLLEGPPPDAILSMPPPPLPSAMLTRSSLLDLTNGTCGHACLWATLEETGLIEVTRRATPALEDMWTILILSASVGLLMVCALLILIALRCREPKVKPVLDECIKTERPATPPEVAVYARIDPLPQPPRDTAWPKALWSGIRVGEPSLYSLEHRAIPPQPDLLASYEYVDYGSVGQTCAKFPTNSDVSLSSSPAPSPTPLDGRRILGDYAVPEGSFENSGYIDSDDPSRTSTPTPRARRLAPDGAVLSPPGVGPIYVGGKDVEILRQRFSNSLRSARGRPNRDDQQPPPLPPPRPLNEKNCVRMTPSPMV